MANIHSEYLYHNGLTFILDRTDDYGTSWYRCEICSAAIDGRMAIEISASRTLVTENLTSQVGGYGSGGSQYVYVPSYWPPGHSLLGPAGSRPAPVQSVVPEPSQASLMFIAFSAMMVWTLGRDAYLRATVRNRGR